MKLAIPWNIIEFILGSLLMGRLGWGGQKTQKFCINYSPLQHTCYSIFLKYNSGVND